MKTDWRYHQIDSQTALLFDFLRGSSAVIVVLGHAIFYFFNGYTSLVRAMLNAGHLAVITFFIISGFMISSSILRRLNTHLEGKFIVREFVRDRLNRLIPPLIAATVIMVICYLILNTLNNTDYKQYWTLKQAIATALFQLEMKSHIPAPVLNGPLWSLSHELWFYAGGVLITLCLIATKKTKAVVALCILAAMMYGLATPKWLMGFAVWLCGGLLALYYHHHRSLRAENQTIGFPPTTDRKEQPGCIGGLFQAITVVSLCVFAAFLVTEQGIEYGRYAFGVFLATTLGCWLAGDQLVRTGGITQRINWRGLSMIIGAIRRLFINPASLVAPYSYTLYVIHFPLLLVSYELSQQWLHSITAALICGVTCMFCALYLAKAIAKIAESPDLTYKLSAALLGRQRR